jgi:hypothetical protein
MEKQWIFYDVGNILKYRLTEIKASKHYISAYLFTNIFFPLLVSQLMQGKQIS